jgi:glycosyltransferase involved in cell wall biosynthesis
MIQTIRNLSRFFRGATPNKFSVNFLLPSPPLFPIGGCKIAYEYANRLAIRGHSVSVTHVVDFDIQNSSSGRKNAQNLARIQERDMRQTINWFDFNQNVRLLCLPYVSHNTLPRVDATIATAWCTAKPAYSAITKQKRKGFYLLQHFEDWDASKEDILDTWKLPLTKIVISHWLGDIATSIGEQSHYNPNGIDFQEFGIDTPPQLRGKSVGMLWHELEWKGSKLGLEAILQTKILIPELIAELFGTGEAPSNLPEWIQYHRLPSRLNLRAIYNRCAVFMTPSFAEGWALPPAEALQCGCCLLATEIGGHKDYAIHGQTAWTVPPGNIEALADGLRHILTSDDERIQLAIQGNDHIQQYTWDRAVTAFEKLIFPT